MARRILFAIRGKLGDSVISFATVRAWADAHPADELTLLVRANYAPLFAREAGIRVIGFASRLAMFAKLVALRWSEPPFDALLVLLGSGAPVRRLGRLVRARRKVFLDARFAEVYPEWPRLPEDHLMPEKAWRVARVCEPSLAPPRRSRIPSLARLRRAAGAIGIAPVADEARRTMNPDAVATLVGVLRARHPGSEIRVLINRDDRDARPLVARGLPPGAAFRPFPSLDALVTELAGLEHLYVTDTGLYHLAVAMGVPCTVFYGPTQPWRNGFPEQPDLVRVRLAALGGEHCEEKGCLHPLCLDQAVVLHCGAPLALDVTPTPAGCLLRRHSPQALATIKVYEGPRHQA